MFFEPLIDNLDGGEQEFDVMEDNGQIEKKIPFYMKGKTFNNTYALIDEAEDLDYKTLKMIGERTGKNSYCVFTGDYKQTERKFMTNNGLLQLIDSAKGNPLCGIIVLSADVRSDASNFFANLY
jgi:predicted ribonuclease YlaK